MLHTYFCSPDKAIKKHRLEALKSMEIELRGFQNPFKKQLQTDTAPEKAFEFQFFRKIVIFQWFLESKNRRKNAENAMLKNNAFFNRFLWEFFSFWLPKNGMKFHCFFGSLSKKQILWKSLFFHKKIAIFLVLSFQNWSKLRCKFLFENYIGKKSSKIEFGHRFWFPKSSKIGPRSDVKQSLFRDAMEPTRKSSQVNRLHSFWTTNLATHMIRSSLWYIHIRTYIHHITHESQIHGSVPEHVGAPWRRLEAMS